MDDFGIEEVFQAYLDCRKNKRTTSTQMDFEQNLERRLCQLHRALNSRTYEIDRTRAFVVTHPKAREVWAGRFRDRVVHHVMYNRIFDRFARRFIYDTYACIPGRGVLFGADRVHRMMRQATENWQRPAWFLQADLANFFVSIDKGILKQQALARIDESELRWLVSMIIDHDPTCDPIIRSPPELFARVPPHKSLFHAPAGKGLPIGNLSSQYFANVYLTPMDQYAKRHLKVRWYARYVDDIVMIGHDPGELLKQFRELARFAERELCIKFHPNKTHINRVERGVNFCGYMLLPHRRYVRRSTVRSMRGVVRSEERESDPQRWRDRLQSYMGTCKHANSYRLRRAVARETGAWFGPRFEKLSPRRIA